MISFEAKELYQGKKVPFEAETPCLMHAVFVVVRAELLVVFDSGESGEE